MEQIAIAIALTGVVAIWLSQSKDDAIRKWSCIFGLVGQPFWFYSSYMAEQWVIFVLCFFYTYAWMTGVKNNWLGKSAIMKRAKAKFYQDGVIKRFY